MKFRPIPPANASEIRRVPEAIASEFTIKEMPEITPTILKAVQQRAIQELNGLHLCPHSAQIHREWVWGMPGNEIRTLLREHVFFCPDGMCPQCLCSIWRAYSLRPNPGEDFWGFLQGYAIGNAMKLGFQFLKK